MQSEHFVRDSMVLLVLSTISAAIHYMFQFGMGRILGPVDYGILATFFSILYIMAAPVQAVQLTLTKFVAEFKAKNDFGAIKDLLSRSTKKIFLLSIGVFVIFILLSSQISRFFNIADNVITITFCFVFIGMFVMPNVRGFLQGMQKFRSLGFNMIAESAIKLLLSLVLVFAGFGITGAIWGTNIATYAAFVLAFLLLYKQLKSHNATPISSEKKSAVYSYSIPMLVALLSITVLYSIDVILVKHFFTAHEAGIYAAASLVAKIILVGLMPISNTMFPKIAELRAKGRNYSGVFAKSVAMVTALSAAATAVYFLAPSIIDKFLFGPEYAQAIPLIGLFGAAISLLSVGYVFVNYFLACGRIKIVYVLPAFAVAETLLLWFFHSSLNEVLLLITTVMAALLATLVVFYFLSKNDNPDNSSI